MEVDRSKNFARKVDAERYLAMFESDKLRGRYADPRLARTRPADWMDEWQATRTNLSPQTRLRRKSHQKVSPESLNGIRLVEPQQEA